jgi:transcriptional regulator with AAA-type ATPase domain
MNKEHDLIKHHLRKLPAVSVEAVTRAWIELVLERHKGNRTTACKDLDISICKIRAWIIDKGVKTTPSKIGHPGKIVKAKMPKKFG